VIFFISNLRIFNLRNFTLCIRNLLFLELCIFHPASGNSFYAISDPYSHLPISKFRIKPRKYVGNDRANVRVSHSPSRTLTIWLFKDDAARRAKAW
jgi:hypothetical protein